MEANLFREKWTELESNVLFYFNKLTADDVATIAGSEDRLMDILHMRYGYSDEQGQDAWDRFVRKYRRA